MIVPIKKKKSQEKLDYEIELAVVIGREAKNVTEDRALDYVFGYFIFGSTLAVSASEIYTYLTSKSLHQTIKFNYERLIAVSFVLLFTMGIFSISLMNYSRKSYLLKNYDQSHQKLQNSVFQSYFSELKIT